jgi:hypothetical protein
MVIFLRIDHYSASGQKDNNRFIPSEERTGVAKRAMVRITINDVEKLGKQTRLKTKV